jgi:Ni,Fe-hydrogenase III small subunit
VLEALRAWLASRGQTTTFPHAPAALPERFRGRPALHAPPGAPAPSRRGLPVIDLGACLFSPEEATSSGECRVVYTRDVGMASATREGLVTASGEPDPVRALDAATRRLFGRSLCLRSVAAGSCNGCEAELVALGNVVFDMARFGVRFVASPRHADGILITGAVNANMREALERTYAAVSDPRIVIAVGACAASGGPFSGSPEVLGIPPSIPVDLWIPGCPPHPLTILDGLLRLLGRLGAAPPSASAPSARDRAPAASAARDARPDVALGAAPPVAADTGADFVRRATGED